MEMLTKPIRVDVMDASDDPSQLFAETFHQTISDELITNWLSLRFPLSPPLGPFLYDDAVRLADDDRRRLVAVVVHPVVEGQLPEGVMSSFWSVGKPELPISLN